MNCERREERRSSWDLCLWEESQKKREITQVETCPGEWTVQATYWVPQSWDPTQGRGAPLAGWRAAGANSREACPSLSKITCNLTCSWDRASFLVAQSVKSPPAMWETQVRALGGEDPLGRKWLPTPVFSPGESHGQRSLVELQSMGSPRVRLLSDLRALSRFEVGQRGAGWVLLWWLL